MTLVHQFVVMLREGVTRPTLLGEPAPVTHEQAFRSAQVVEAATARDAAEAWRCSVWDLRVGAELVVYRLPMDGDMFHREYADKGGNDWDQFPSDPVTIGRGRVGIA